ncbi:MAG TPA: EamA family transporter, partial [Phaeodactylibacter sp.]|nr:EamA family transporter [Phaeodactylibacter sp.]
MRDRIPAPQAHPRDRFRGRISLPHPGLDRKGRPKDPAQSRAQTKHPSALLDPKRHRVRTPARQLANTLVQMMISREAKSFALLIALGLVWGSSYILIKRGLEVFSPGQVATLRLSITALFFLPILLKDFRQMPWAHWKPLLAVGIVGNLLPFFFFALAQTRLS